MSRAAVQVVAHRGASEVEAEHTVAAYDKAIAGGADALEADVRLTRDGVLVCVHDRRVNRVSDGRGAVSALELADLADLDFASWKDLPASDEAPDWDRAGVLTLERLIQLALDAPAGSRPPVQLHIETKHPTRYGGLVELRLVELLDRYGLAHPTGPSRVTVMSFSAASLRRVRQLAPSLPTVYLMRWVPIRYRDGSLPAAATIAGPSLAILRAHPSYVRRAHDQGHRVHVFTVDAPEDIDYVLELGVDAVISNAPDRVLQRRSRV